MYEVRWTMYDFQIRARCAGKQNKSDTEFFMRLPVVVRKRRWQTVAARRRPRTRYDGGRDSSRSIIMMTAVSRFLIRINDDISQ